MTAELPRHSPGFRSVLWTGASEPFSFTPTQAAVVGELWEAWLQRVPDISIDTLHERADFKVSMTDLFRVSVRSNGRRRFRRHEALGVMIIPGPTRGTWRLAGSPPEQIPNIGTARA